MTVTAARELTVEPEEVSFSEVDWETAKTVTVAAGEDGDAVANAPVQVRHAVSGGGYGGAEAPSVQVIIVEDDVSSVAVGEARASEHAGRLGFEVTLSLASAGLVTVDYATGGAGDSATDGHDYTGVSGRLSFAAGSTRAQTIEVTVLDDAYDEADEVVEVTLSNAAGAVLAGGGSTATARGVIEDDDPAPELSIEAGRLQEGAGDGLMRFAVTLSPASGRTVTVNYATADGTATAGADYTAMSDALTFLAGDTERTVAVPIADDQDPEEDETFSVTLTLDQPSRATLSDAAATGTIEDDRRPVGARTDIAAGQRRRHDVPGVRFGHLSLRSYVHRRYDPSGRRRGHPRRRNADPVARRFG